MKSVSISDDRFLELLEDKDMPSSFFDHAGHMRAAWLYVERYPIAVAVEKCCDSIRFYAESLGAKDKYHATVTVAMVSLVASYALPGSRYRSWQDLVTSQELIIVDAQRFLLQYYSPSLLGSSAARAAFCPPDKRPFGIA